LRVSPRAFAVAAKLLEGLEAEGTSTPAQKANLLDQAIDVLPTSSKDIREILAGMSAGGRHRARA
jgi:hypothetical protein